MNRTRERILLALLEKGTIEFWQLARIAGYLEDIIRECEQLKEEGIVSLEKSMVTLTAKEKIPVELLKNPAIDSVMNSYREYRKQIHFADDDLDQLQITPEGIENKLACFLKNQDLRGRDVLCLGDDDLFSVACSLTSLPRSVTVFDADTKLLEFLEKVSTELPVPIQAVNLNFLKEIPEQWKKRFDVFVTEPPDTVKGTLLFISRGLSCLRPGGVMYLGITEETLKWKQWQIIQEKIICSGLAITDILRDHEVYETDEETTWKGYENLPGWISKNSAAPWYSSALVRAQAARDIIPFPVEFKHVERELITSLLP